MQSQDEKIRVSSASIASGDGVYVGAMLFGLCGAMRRCLENINSYNELLEDEVEDTPSALAYLEGQKDNLQKLLSMLDAPSCFMQDPQKNERLHLIKLVEGVLDRYHSSSTHTGNLDVDIDDSLFVRCNPFQIQQLLFEVLCESHLNENEDNWELSCKRITFNPNELGALGLDSKDGKRDYVVLRLFQKTERLPLVGNYLPLDVALALWPNLSVEKLYLYVQWLGQALLNGAKLLLRSEENSVGMALLFPSVKEWEERGSDDLMHYRWNNEALPKTILLVDDEDMIWDVITEMLQDLGYNVVLAGNGQEAIDIYGANPGKIDLVILDMLMPEMGGKEAFYILKKIDPNVKVLVSSGYVSEDEIQDVMDDGAAGFLRKPYRMADLAKKIKNILQVRE